jgi:hypothetical protein
MIVETTAMRLAFRRNKNKRNSTIFGLKPSDFVNVVKITNRATEANFFKPMQTNKFPLVYELNTRVWLRELSRKAGKALTLADVPDSEFQKWQDLRADALWLMGVWQESAKGQAIAQTHSELWQNFKATLPDAQLADVVASPYCIPSYSVADALGGDGALQRFRQRLADVGIKLILDFVPNHVALDHSWIQTHPEFFIAVSEETYQTSPESYYKFGNTYFACGRDPYFPAWTDTLQLNYSNPALHDAMIDVLKSVAARCDGVRCDMAMLVDTFNQTWAHLGARNDNEFWSRAISSVKAVFPQFIFIAEAYWETEWTLQQRGFDFTYDKRLYDRIALGNIDKIRGHLNADLSFQQKLFRFTENHDEERAIKKFGENHKAAALLTFTAVGARLLHEGQADGWRIKLPVQLIRRPEESADTDTAAFYHRLSHLLENPAITNGDFHLLRNEGDERIIAFERVSGGNTGHILVFCNFSDELAESLFSTVAFNAVEDYEHLEIVSTERFRSPQFELSKGNVTVRLRPHEGIVFVLR